MHSSPALWVWCLMDFQIKHFAANPLPMACLALRKDHEDSFRLKTDPSLSLIIKRPIQTAHVEVYPRRFLESRRFDGGFVRGYLQASLPFLDGIIPNLEMAVNSAWWFSINWD